MTEVSSIQELEKELTKRTKKAVSNVREKIYDIINRKLYEYYGEYTPEQYERTKQILYSLVRISTANGMGFKVYFDYNGIKYKTGDWGTPDVYKNVLTTGLHTPSVSGTNVWVESKEEIGDITELIRKELIAQGIDTV